MSMKKRRGGLVISWHRSISILTPWRKGKDKDRDAVLETEVVLTKLKFFSNFQDKVLTSSDCVTDNSTVSTSVQDRSDLNMVHETDSHLNNNSVSPQTETGPDFLPAVFSNSHLPRLYKFESEDSGVDLASGANSPSTPMGSEQSFVVHSRESSCHSCNLNSDVAVLPQELVKQAQDCETEDSRSPQDNISICSVEFCSSVEAQKDNDRPSGTTPEEHKEASEHVEETTVSPEKTCPEEISVEKQSLSETRDDVKGSEPESRRKSTTSEGLEEYMEECCRLSQELPVGSNPLGSGLGYLGHICQLLEKIGQLQETNLKLQRQICGLQKDSRMTKAKEDFFHQHCSCGAASLIFQPALKRQSRNEFPSLSGTMSDLSTIPEVGQHHLTPNTDSRSETPWRRGLNRRSYTEGEVRLLGDSTEGLSQQLPQRRFSDNYSHTWGRVKDLVKKTRGRNQSRLGLVSPSLKMSCPQLYRPDLGPVEPAVHRNRNSMIVLGHQSKTDFPWSP